MKTGTRLALFGAGLLTATAVAYAVGQVSDVHDAGATQGTTAHGGGHGGHGAAQIKAAGLSGTAEGFSLHLDSATREEGSTAPFTFAVHRADGSVLTSYTKTHTKDLHLIVVDKGLRTFHHLHPTRDAQGTWSVALPDLAPGPYRVYADFAPDDRDRAIVLSADLTVPGLSFVPSLPPVGTTAFADGDRVEVEGALQAQSESMLSFTVMRGPDPVALEPYLGAFGHLVLIRAGDLAYLHVHPEDGDGLRFVAEVPTAGTYRAFLDYQHDGTVRTAAFTVTARE